METEAGSSRVVYYSYSVRDIIRILYMQGLVKLFYWDEIFENLKLNIVNESSVIVNLYFILYNAITDFFKDELSQAKVLNEKHRIISINELNDYFNTIMPKEQLDLKTIDVQTVQIFKDLVKREYKILYEIDNDEDKGSTVVVNSESDDDDDNDEDIFEKEFQSILKTKDNKNKVTNSKFEQTFNLQSNNKINYLKTPGENGQFLVEIKLWDTKDLKKIPSDQWWTKVSKKGKFILLSSSDPLFISINNVFKLGFDRIKTTKGVLSGTYGSCNRFKPY